MEAIILAGGFGTRLQGVVSNVPKPMAPINEKPFLEYVINSLVNQNITKVVISAGYMADKIIGYFEENYKNIGIIYSVESEPLGTGGAAKMALSLVNSEDIYILNGDTFFNINLKDLMKFHKEKGSDITLSLKRMDNADRYGTVEINEYYIVTGFKEKQFNKLAYINAGIYVVKKNIFNKFNYKDKFSFEKDFIEKYQRNLKMYGYISDNYFIDIGIPDDYKKAKLELMNYL